MSDNEIREVQAEIDITTADIDFEKAKAIATLIIVCAVNVFNVLGYAVDAEPWVNAVTSVLAVISIAYAWWKNQNVTPEAAQAQVLLDALKLAKHAKANDEDTKLAA